jgi:ribosome biogenesis GTPase
MSELYQGIVVASRGKSFDVRTPDQVVYRCDVRQKVKAAADRETPVAVGDDVCFTGSPDLSGAIDKVLPRRSTFSRPAKGGETANRQIIAANLDQLVIIASVASPPLKTGLIDRFIIAGRMGQMSPVIVMNKIDLDDSKGTRAVATAYRDAGFVCHPVSAETGVGIEDLRVSLNQHRSLFVGHSGVGKSTILNALLPGLDLKTNEISDFSNRGKHTTTAIELYELPTGGFVADSPGLKVMGFDRIDTESVAEYYPEFERYRGDCKFQPCSHLHEPGCAVKAALAEGKISMFRYENYAAIIDSM